MKKLIAARRTPWRFSASGLVGGRGFRPLACPDIRFLRPLAFPALLILLQYGTWPRKSTNQGLPAKRFRSSCRFVHPYKLEGDVGTRQPSAGKHCPFLCHLDRSAAQWRDLRSSGPFLEMFLQDNHISLLNLESCCEPFLSMNARHASLISNQG
jgi:hypothetical protein